MCEIVSKAALKLKRITIQNTPESAAVRRPEVIFSRAVSMLWRGRKPDGKGS